MVILVMLTIDKGVIHKETIREFETPRACVEDMTALNLWSKVYNIKHEMFDCRFEKYIDIRY